MDNQTQLYKAIKYGVSNGGKRLRPYFIVELSKILKIPKISYKQIALSVEFIHCYSLIHDDLPSMDNDDFRRGKLTVHKKFNESTAILAGNCLYNMAIEIILDSKTSKNNGVRLELLKMITHNSGPDGLMLGQYYDLFYENKNTGIKNILNTYSLKTSKLFELSMSMPFVLQSKSNKEIKNAKLYGRNFGLIYQIADDFSDLDKEFSETGKIPGKDKEKGKNTIISKVGRKSALNLCHELAKEATKDNRIFGNNDYKFKELIFDIVAKITY
ncbi:polyprenyl synthetase family protein [bacterium]|nr:polyprenyl synthetase family protein [bacterium]MDG2006649.1 polyprenyl synthetase family protein [Thermodesulfobacteriota bacterium]